MFRTIRHTLVLTVAALCTAAVAAGAAYAQPRYDAYHDALRVQPLSAKLTPSVVSSFGATHVVISGQATYDPYLDALRIRPRSTDRRLAIGSRPTMKTAVARPCGRCQ